MDTTVILAQQRVPRLRADAVYVKDRGSVGEPVDRWIWNAIPGAGTPKNLLYLKDFDAKTSPPKVGHVLRIFNSY